MEEVTVKVNKATLFAVAGLIIGLGLGYTAGLWRSEKISATNKNDNQIVLGQNQPTNNQPIPEQNPIVKISIKSDDHIRGAKNAKVTLVEYSDFQCPYCQRHFSVLKQALAEYKDIALVYRHYPLSFHQNAQIAAEGSECAAEQGKFWEYHDVLFQKGQGDGTGLTPSDLEKYAKDLGLNSSKFNDCLAAKKYSTRVTGDLSEGNAFGVQGTPATFVVDKDGNGELVSGAVPYEALKAAIDAKL